MQASIVLNRRLQKNADVKVVYNSHFLFLYGAAEYLLSEVNTATNRQATYPAAFEGRSG